MIKLTVFGIGNETYLVELKSKNILL